MVSIDEGSRQDETDSGRETIEIDADVLRNLAWGHMPEMPRSHVQSFHPEIDEEDVVIHGLKSHVEKTSYDPDEEMIYFSGKTEVTLPADSQSRDNTTTSLTESWPIYFGVALYPTGVGDRVGPSEVYLDIEKV
jgi:hypothetical protein